MIDNDMIILEIMLITRKEAKEGLSLQFIQIGGNLVTGIHVPPDETKRTTHDVHDDG